MQSEQNLVKSIIYGSPLTNNYGTFRSLCSAITYKGTEFEHLDQIDKIIFYLRNNQNFKKYNKFVYAFRLQLSQNQTFITHPQQDSRIIQGYNDDIGLQGNGQKLLNLLKKFNVRNVLVIVAIRQKDPLRDFTSENQVQIVKTAKDLLSSLYDKVLQAKENPHAEEEYVYQPLQVKQFFIPLEQGAFIAMRKKKNQNVNYVGKQYIRTPPPNKQQSKLTVQMQYLNQKIQQLANKLEDAISEFNEIQDSQVQFAIRYDKNKEVSKAFALLADLFGMKSKEQLALKIKSFDGPNKMSQFLKSITVHTISSQKIRQINQQLLSNEMLKQAKIKKKNFICGMVMKFVQILLKSYSFARKLALIESEFQENNQQSHRPTEQAQEKPLNTRKIQMTFQEVKTIY